jgi:hypothetical protein
VFPLDRGERVPDHGERAVPEEIHLHEAVVLDLILLPLHDRNALRRDLDRHVIGQRVGHEHDASRVHGEVPWMPLERGRERHDLGPRGLEVDVLKPRMAPHLLDLVLVAPERGEALRDVHDLGFGKAVDLGDLVDRAAPAKADVIRDHRRAHGGAVLFEHVELDLVALVPGEVDVDVRRIGARRREKPLEEEVVPHGIDVGDREQIRHDARRSGPAAADARRPRRDRLHDEEVIGEALVANDRELAVEPRCAPPRADSCRSDGGSPPRSGPRGS